MAATHSDGTEDHRQVAHAGGIRTHVLVAVALAVFTLLAFGAVGGRLLPTSVLVPLIFVLAVAQIVLQGLFYMHLRWDRRFFSLVFVAAVVGAAFIAWAAWYLLLVHPGRT